MSHDTLIDYAHPMMMCEKAMKKAHDYLLEGDYVLAMDQLTLAMVEAKMALNSVRHMLEQQDALRQQTQTV
jgi:type I site-specific restriction endonuclease